MEIRIQFSELQGISIMPFFLEYLPKGKVGKHAFIYVTNPYYVPRTVLWPWGDSCEQDRHNPCP